jgi:hypothetical protein
MSVVRLMMLVRCPQVAAFAGFAANGHFYEWIIVPAGITWTAAKAQAESSTHL